jgi:hypothetical protein
MNVFWPVVGRGRELLDARTPRGHGARARASRVTGVPGGCGFTTSVGLRHVDLSGVSRPRAMIRLWQTPCG